MTAQSARGRQTGGTETIPASEYRKMSRDNPEERLHLDILGYLRGVLPPSHIVAHIPNGERRDAKTGAKLKRMGVVAGMPDLIIIRPGGRIVGIEIKARGGSKSKAQREFALHCIAWGIPYITARSIDDVRAFLAQERVETRDTWVSVGDVAKRVVEKAGRAMRGDEQ